MILETNQTAIRRKKKAKSRPFYQKYFYIVNVIIALAILLPGYFLLLKPERDSYESDSSSLAEAQSKLSFNVKKLVEQKQISSSYANISQEKSSKVEEIISIGIDKPSLYVNMEGIANLAEVALGNITIAENVDSSSQARRPGAAAENDSTDFEGKLRRGRISVSFSEVTYAKLQSLLTAFETNLRLLDVNSFSYNAADGLLNVDLIVYYLQ